MDEKFHTTHVKHRLRAVDPDQTLTLEGARASAAAVDSTFSSAASEVALHHEPANTYDEAPALKHPQTEITLDAFMDFARQRVQIYGFIEHLRSLGTTWSVLETKVSGLLKQQRIAGALDDYSHYFVALALASANEDTRATFIDFESVIFTSRFDRASVAARQETVAKFGFKSKPVMFRTLPPHVRRGMVLARFQEHRSTPSIYDEYSLYRDLFSEDEMREAGVVPLSRSNSGSGGSSSSSNNTLDAKITHAALTAPPQHHSQWRYDPFFDATDGRRPYLPETPIAVVPFELVLSGVSKRRVFLHRGEAYVHYGHFRAHIQTEFRRKLQTKLQQMAEEQKQSRSMRNLVQILLQVRALFVRKFPPRTLSNSGANTGLFNSIPAATPFLPPCAMWLIGAGANGGHLDFFARTQLTMLLSNVRVAPERVIEFMGQLTPSDRKKNTLNEQRGYTKNATTLIRKRVVPHGCASLLNAARISSAPQGCPFVGLTETALRALLGDAVSDGDMLTIQGYRWAHKHQHACGVYLAAKTKQPFAPVASPAAFVSACCKAHK